MASSSTTPQPLLLSLFCRSGSTEDQHPKSFHLHDASGQCTDDLKCSAGFSHAGTNDERHQIRLLTNESMLLLRATRQLHEPSSGAASGPGKEDPKMSSASSEPPNTCSNTANIFFIHENPPCIEILFGPEPPKPGSNLSKDSFKRIEQIKTLQYFAHLSRTLPRDLPTNHLLALPSDTPFDPPAEDTSKLSTDDSSDLDSSHPSTEEILDLEVAQADSIVVGNTISSSTGPEEPGRFVATFEYSGSTYLWHYCVVTRDSPYDADTPWFTVQGIIKGWLGKKCIIARLDAPEPDEYQQALDIYRHRLLLIPRWDELNKILLAQFPGREFPPLDYLKLKELGERVSRLGSKAAVAAKEADNLFFLMTEEKKKKERELRNDI